MEELISKQQAIDALNGMITGATESGYEWIYKDDALNAVKQLPSAQPEIIQCKDCVWWTKQDDSLQGRCALLQIYPTGGWFCGNADRITK